MLSFLDLLGACAAVGLVLGTGFFCARRGARNTGEFMLGGRRLRWWIAGTAMAAGASNADSPLHQSGKIRRDGLTGAWFYWSQVIGHLFGAIVFSRWWRRSGLTSIAEFYAIRYADPARTVGRVWAMGFISFVEGTFGLALGLLALVKITEVLFGVRAPVPVLGWSVPPGLFVIGAAIGLAASYSTVSGLLGVVAGDAAEFLFALAASYTLAFFAFRAIGYGDGLREGLAQLGEPGWLSLWPQWGFSLVALFLLQPLATLAGNNGVNQRYLALRDERQAMLSGLWRILNHYFLRCWPWYVCGVCSIVLIDASEVPHELAYLELIVRYVPEGLRGLMFGGFLVAFMGLASTAMHTSGTLFVNDFYRAYLVRGASDRHYVWATRGAMLLYAAAGTTIALNSDHLLGLLQFSLKMSGAAGLAMALRWFWWRVNGWADFAAKVLALPVTLLFEHSALVFGPRHDPVAGLMRLFGGGTEDDLFGVTFALTLVTTTALWLLVMALTPPEPAATLAAFYRRVRPYGWWGPVAARCPEVRCTDRFRDDLRLYLLGLGTAACLIGAGAAALFGYVPHAVGAVAVAVAGGVRLVRGIDALHRRTSADRPPAAS